MITQPEASSNTTGWAGAKWLVERVYHEREAELQARVDRARVRIAQVGAGERTRAIALVRAFGADMRALGLRSAGGNEGELDVECEAALVEGPP